MTMRHYGLGKYTGPLAAGIKHMTDVNVLNLEDNRISAKGAQYITQSIQANTNIQEVCHTHM